MEVSVKSVVLVRVAAGGEMSKEDFRIETSALRVELKEGELLLRVLVMSADPYLRSRFKMGSAPRVVEAFVAGKVEDSRGGRFAKGALIGLSAPLSTHLVLTADQQKSAWDLTPYISEEQISHGISVLGMPGSTSYAGVLGVLQAKKGETIFISSAAGAVGSVAGQIAKNVIGCKVIGTAGGPEKCALAEKKFGFDKCIDYKQCKSTEDLVAKIREAAPEGIDMNFENVGGMHFEACMATLRPLGRVAICGTISNYNADGPGLGNSNVTFNISSMIYTQQRIEGFLCGPWLRGDKGNFLADMAQYLKSGQVTTEETASTESSLGSMRFSVCSPEVTRERWLSSCSTPKCKVCVSHS